MSSKNEIINMLKLSMNLKGFKENLEEQGVYWHKKFVDRTHSLYIGFNGSVDRYFLQSPFASIRFHEIEEKIIHKSKELGFPINVSDYTIKNKALKDSEFNYAIFETRIDSKEIFEEVFVAEMEYINMTILPFFETNQDLFNVAELLSNLKPQEVVPYIQGAKLFCKTILILKEANHPSFESKRDEFYEVLKKQATKKDIYNQQLQVFESLFYSEVI